MRNSVLPSSKVAQMASIFQSPGGSDCATTVPSVITRKPSDIPREPRATFPSSNSSNSISHNSNGDVKRAKVSVHRTESHHERFSTARALFERMGSGDNLLEESRSQSSHVTSPSGSRTSSVSHRPGSRTDSESGLSSSRHSMQVRSRSSSPQERESRSSSVSSTAEYLRNGLSQTSPNKQPPDKPERKINAKEAISKQRNWFSNFEKSKSSPGPESVDSARRTSVNKENKPNFISGLTEPHSSPLRATPLSPNHQSQSKTISPKTSDSIEAYMQNWKKTPSSSKSEIW